MTRTLQTIKEPEVTLALTARTYIRLHNAALGTMSSERVAVLEETVLSFLTEYYERQHALDPQSVPSVEINLVQVVSEVLHRAPLGTHEPNYIDIETVINGVSLEPLENYNVLTRESFNTPEGQSHFINMIHAAARRCDDADVSCMAGSYFNPINRVEGFSFWQLSGGDPNAPGPLDGTVEDARGIENSIISPPHNEAEALAARETMDTYNVNGFTTESWTNPDPRAHEQDMVSMNIVQNGLGLRRTQNEQISKSALNAIYAMALMSCLCIYLVIRMLFHKKKKSHDASQDNIDEGNVVKQVISRNLEEVISRDVEFSSRPRGILKSPPTTSLNDVHDDDRKIV